MVAIAAHLQGLVLLRVPVREHLRAIVPVVGPESRAGARWGDQLDEAALPVAEAREHGSPEVGLEPPRGAALPLRGQGPGPDELVEVGGPHEGHDRERRHVAIRIRTARRLHQRGREEHRRARRDDRAERAHHAIDERAPPGQEAERDEHRCGSGGHEREGDHHQEGHARRPAAPDAGVDDGLGERVQRAHRDERRDGRERQRRGERAARANRPAGEDVEERLAREEQDRDEGRGGDVDLDLGRPEEREHEAEAHQEPEGSAEDEEAEGARHGGSVSARRVGCSSSNLLQSLDAAGCLRRVRPARRLTSAVLLAALALAGACRGSAEQGPAPARSAPPVAGSATAIAAHPTALSALAVEEIETAERSARALHVRLEVAPGGPPYFELRRSVARAAPFVRARVHASAEVLFGPQRPAEEGAGALAALDVALSLRDPRATYAALGQVERALELAAEEIDRGGLPAGTAATALSDAAYDLGAAILEATPDLPADPAAILQQQRGELAAIEDGAAALARDLALPAEQTARVSAAAAPIRAALDGARTSLDLAYRGALAVATGRLGAAIRLLAEGVARTSTSRTRRGSRSPVKARRSPCPCSRCRARGGPPRARTSTGGSRRWGAASSATRACPAEGCDRAPRRHDPARGFTDGRVTPASLVPGGPALRHTPTLLYTSLHAAQMWDGSILTPETQALHVIHARAEMGLGDGETRGRARREPGVPRGALAGAGGAGAHGLRGRGARPGGRARSTGSRAGRSPRSPWTSAGARRVRGQGAVRALPRAAALRRDRAHAISACPCSRCWACPTRRAGRAIDPDRGRASSRGARRRARVQDAHGARRGQDRALLPPRPLRAPRGHRRLLRPRRGARPRLDVPNQDPEVRPLTLTAEEKRVLLVFLREALLDASPPR